MLGEFLRSLSNPKKVSIISGKNVKKIIGKEIDESLKNCDFNTIVLIKLIKNFYSAALDNSSLYFLNSSLATALL